MASFTKKAIVASFLKMCAKKLPDKITVRDIVDDCEINRNTFYYYFQDIYALIDEVFGIWSAEFVSSCEEGGDMVEGLCSFTEWALEHRRAVIHLTIAFDGSTVEDYYLRAAGDAWSQWVRGQAREQGASEEAVRYIGATLALAFFSIVRRWIKSGMKEEPRRVVEHFAVTWLGSVSYMLDNYDSTFTKNRQFRKND